MATSYVLLQSSVPSLGLAGDLVKVKAGYARNYLLPRGLGVLADTKNKRQLEHQNRLAQIQKQKELAAAQDLAKAVSAVSLTISKAVGEEDRIFGSVTTDELAKAFVASGYEIDKRAITILDDIKRIGVYKGSVKLHPEVHTQFNIWVVAQN